MPLAQADSITQPLDLAILSLLFDATMWTGLEGRGIKVFTTQEGGKRYFSLSLVLVFLV